MYEYKFSILRSTVETVQEFHRQAEVPVVFAEKYNKVVPDPRRLF